MPLSLRDVLLGLAVPAVISMIGGWWGVSRIESRRGQSMCCAAAVTLAYLAGYWSLDLGPFIPEFDRQWLPYAAVFGWLASLGGRPEHRLSVVRVLVSLFATATFAWLIVPDWPHLQPSRTIHVVFWFGYTVTLSLAVQWVVHRLGALPTNSAANDANGTVRPVRPPECVALLLMAGTLACSSALLAISGSSRFAQTTAAAMAAVLGLTVVLWRRDTCPPLVGVAGVYVFVTAAALFTGKVNSFSDIPTVSYLLLPTVPLALALVHSGPDGTLSRRTLIVATLVGIGLASLALGLAITAWIGGSESAAAV